MWMLPSISCTKYFKKCVRKAAHVRKLFSSKSPKTAKYQISTKSQKYYEVAEMKGKYFPAFAISLA